MSAKLPLGKSQGMPASGQQSLLMFKGISLPHLLIITVLWVGMILLVNPIGNFPLNDDWAYAYSVRSVLEQGDFQLSQWTAANLISHVYWGVLFCLPFGFSFTALRLSTLLLGWLGVLLTYLLLRQVNASSRVALFGALLVAFNPVYLALSHSFMSDVPFVAVALLAFCCLLYGLQTDSLAAIGLGVVFSGIAILNRQIGLALPIAFGCAYVTKKGVKLSTLVLGFLPVLLGLGLQFGYQGWLRHTSRLPASFGNQISTLQKQLAAGLASSVTTMAGNTAIILIYLGLFLLPFLLVFFFNSIRQGSMRQQFFIVLILSALAAATLGVLKLKQQWMPLAGNVLIDFGLGPVGLNYGNVLMVHRFVWQFITLLGVVGASLILYFLVIALYRLVQPVFQSSQPESLNESPPLEAQNPPYVVVFILATLLIYYLPLSLLGLETFGFYDRYLIFLLPLLLMLVVVLAPSPHRFNNTPNWLVIPVVLMLLGSGLFAVAGTHDYLAWNRSRWQAIDDLVNVEKVPPERIDGGFEFDGWYFYDRDRGKPGWDQTDNDYILSLQQPVPGFSEVKRYPFTHWLPKVGQGDVLVLKKSAS